MDVFNALGYLGPLLIGLSLLWAVKLVYGAQTGVSDDLAKRVLLLAGWILTLAGTILVTVGLLGPLAIVPLFGLLLTAAAYFSYVQAERRALLRLLAIAAQKGIPLDQAASAFADERSVQLGVRASRLAQLLAAGASLSAALDISRNPLPTDALLAARLGEASGQMGMALRLSVRQNDHFVLAMRGIVARYFYLLAVIAVGALVVTFVMLKIVPVFSKMFEEFELQLPAMTEWLIAVSEFVVYYWWLLSPLLAVLLLLGFAGIALSVGWTRQSFPIVDRLWLRCDSALVLRALALAVRHDRAIPAMVFQLSRQYPRANIGRRLTRASSEIDNGVHWCDALRTAGLIRGTEAAVLKAAERVGNLAWALEEMADSVLRRFSLRLKTVLSITLPLAVILVGLIVCFIVTSLFLPLVSIIQALA